jgi:hypothetical protein
MGLIVVAAYLCLVGVILVAAFRHRRPGWIAGAIFAVMLLTLPAWVLLMIWIVSPWLPEPVLGPNWKPQYQEEPEQNNATLSP